jgi:hypothetical protein
MSDLQKLAYAYNNLMVKTAAPGDASEQLAQKQLDALNAKGFFRTQGGRLNEYLSEDKNQDKLINRGAIGLLGGTVAGGIGSLGSSEARNRLRDAGFSSRELDDVLTAGGGAARTIGSAGLGGATGAGLGYGAGRGINYLLGDTNKIEGLDSMLAALGGAGGAAYGTASGYEGELGRADEAIAQRQYDKLVRAAKNNKKPSKKRRRR